MKTVLWLVIGAAVVAAAWTAYVSWPKPSPRIIPSIPQGIILKNIKYTKTKHGRAIWSISAQRAEHNPDTGITKSTNIRLVFHRKNGKDIVLTANRAQIDSGNGTLTVSGNVRIESQPGRLLLTDRLTYNEETRILKTDSPVSIEMDHSVIHGKGMIIDTRNQEMEILSSVNASLDREAQ